MSKELKDILSELTLDNVKSLPIDQLLHKLFNSLLLMMDVNFIREIDHERAKNIVTPRFDDIKRDITFEHLQVKDGLNPDKLKRVYKVKVPVYDERKRERYKKRPNKLPETGKFVQSDASLTIRPLGLLELLIQGSQLSRMDKDTRNLTPIRTFTLTDYMYYTYGVVDEKENSSDQEDIVEIENEDSKEERFKYTMVQEEAIEKALRKLKKGKSVADLDIQDKHVEVYLERYEVLEAAEARLKEYSESFQDKFEDSFLHDRYNSRWENGEIKLDPSGQTYTIIPQIKDIEEYLKRYNDFLIESLPEWLKIKLVFASISRKEYDVNIEELERLKEVCESGKNTLENLKKVLMSNNKSQVSGEEIEKGFNPENISWSLIDNDPAFEQGKLQSKLIGYFKKLEQYVTARPEKMMELDNPEKGYIKVDIESREAIPNIAEIERRRSLTEDHFSIDKEKEYIEELINYLREKAEAKEKPEH